jgi:hypothetical protein
MKTYTRNPISDGWSYGDIGNYYGAGCSLLTITIICIKFILNLLIKSAIEAKVLRTEPYYTNLILLPII